MIKKFFILIILTAIIGNAGAPCIAVYASADGQEKTHGERIRHSNENCAESVLFTSEITSGGSDDGIVRTGVNTGLLEYFQQETEALEDAYIDLSDYNLSIDEFDSIYRLLVFCSPKSYYLMYTNGTYSYDIDIDFENNTVCGVWPIYTIDVFDDNLELDSEKVAALMPEIEANRQLFEDEYQNAMRVVNYGMSETEKLITFQNYIHFKYTYAMDEYNSPFISRTHNTALELIKDKTGMCQAYSVFFNYLMMREGLETAFVTSYDQDGNEFHVWNMVKVSSPFTENEYCWYHIDTTWNDLENDGYGITDMKYFMLSDTEMRKSHDNIWMDDSYVTYGDIGVETGTAFDSAYWRESVSQAVPFMKKWYFILDMQDRDCPSIVCCFDPRSGEYSELCEFQDDWDNFSDTFAGLGCVNGTLYFNGPKCIYSYDLANPPEGNTPTLFKEINLPDGYSIYSSYIGGARLYYGIASAPDYYTNIVEGGSILLDSFVISEVRTDGEKLHMRLATDDVESDPQEVLLAAKYSDGHLWTYSGVIDGMEWFEFDDDTNGSHPEIFVWDENMRPYIDRYYIEGIYYDYK